MWLFGKSKEPAAQAQPQVSASDAIQKQRAALDTLEKRVVFLEKKITAQDNEAREKARNKDKRGALLALKKKKMLNSEIDTLNNSRVTLEKQIMNLEAAQTQNVAIEALKTGVQAQKDLNAKMNVDKVDQLMEDLQEQEDLQKEVQQVLGQGNDMADDDELLDELAELEAAEFEAQAADMAHVPTGAPSAAAPTAAAAGYATSKPAVAAAAPSIADGLTEEERRELAALQAEMS